MLVVHDPATVGYGTVRFHVPQLVQDSTQIHSVYFFSIFFGDVFVRDVKKALQAIVRLVRTHDPVPRCAKTASAEICPSIFGTVSFPSSYEPFQKWERANRRYSDGFP